VPRAHCPKPTAPLAVASWHRSPHPVTGPLIGQSGPLAVVTGPLHKFGPQPWQYRRSVARGPLSGPFRYRVKNRRNPPKNRDFRAAAHAVADAS
tara:strand:- start:25 stop:306 length:282 start_codon:yes stop_codon:yes gene_type:complete